jgi:hypothetical protein
MNSVASAHSLDIVSDAYDPDPTHLKRGIRPVKRAPRADDAAGTWNLVQKTPVLDPNSAYADVLRCTDFVTTGAVAEAGD